MGVCEWPLAGQGGQQESQEADCVEGDHDPAPVLLLVLALAGAGQ